MKRRSGKTTLLANFCATTLLNADNVLCVIFTTNERTAKETMNVVKQSLEKEKKEDHGRIVSMDENGKVVFETAVGHENSIMVIPCTYALKSSEQNRYTKIFAMFDEHCWMKKDSFKEALNSVMRMQESKVLCIATPPSKDQAMFGKFQKDYNECLKTKRTD